MDTFTPVACIADGDPGDWEKETGTKPWNSGEGTLHMYSRCYDSEAWDYRQGNTALSIIPGKEALYFRKRADSNVPRARGTQ
jgi:hypothetical protein